MHQTPKNDLWSLNKTFLHFISHKISKGEQIVELNINKTYPGCITLTL